MNPSNLHTVILQGLQAAYGLNDRELSSFLERMHLAQECQKFIVGAQTLPVNSMRMAVGFVDKYFGFYPCAKFKDHGRGKFELTFYRYEDNVRVGVGLIIRRAEFSTYQLQNLNGSEAVSGDRTFLL